MFISGCRHTLEKLFASQQIDYLAARTATGPLTTDEVMTRWPFPWDVSRDIFCCKCVHRSDECCTQLRAVLCFDRSCPLAVRIPIALALGSIRPMGPVRLR
jgi:hypothetical protein